ncbi:ATP-binding cassette domain-containing protein [candidate division WOR-3 bacterium]|nr:ATP-binding cassette domain-containing protein [candidate division WOR-3 bacterium]
MIKIANLKKSFNDNHVLCGINLEIPVGSTTVVIGSSGCGKTVLLKHIIGLMRPDDGKVAIDGIEISGIYGTGLFKLRQRMGMVFQGSALLDSLTVYENISLGLREHKRLSKSELHSIVKEKLSLVHLVGAENLMPSQLSGGMKKRVAIARALAINPDYILYDEPTTALDPITAKKIDSLICDLQVKLSITTIAVTHDLVSAYKIGNKIAMLAEGKIIFEGTPMDIKKCKKKEIQEFIKGRIYE